MSSYIEASSRRMLLRISFRPKGTHQYDDIVINEHDRQIKQENKRRKHMAVESMTTLRFFALSVCHVRNITSLKEFAVKGD